MDDIEIPTAGHGNSNNDDIDNDIENEISQEDSWVIINNFFEEKGLVRQQLDSFNEFAINSIQEIVEDLAPIVLLPQGQHDAGGMAPEEKRYTIKFVQSFLSKPMFAEVGTFLFFELHGSRLSRRPFLPIPSQIFAPA